MAREITHTATEPLKLDADDIDAEKGNIAICLCGLSATYPFCDGSHRNIDEDPQTRYKYTGDVDDGKRREIDRICFVDDADP